jgi:type II secretory pathway component PulK
LISIVALWILAVLSLVSVGAARDVSLEIKLAQYQVDRLRAGEAAEAGIRRAAAEVQACLVGIGCDGAGWMANDEAFRDVKLDGASFSISYERGPLEEGPATIYGVLDEERKINVNTASARVLARLPGMTHELLDRILDRRDLLTRSGDGATRAPFRTPEDLRDIPGMTAEAYERLYSCLTVYGSGRVNMNTAPYYVLQALGLPPSVIGRMEAIRGEGHALGAPERLLDDLERFGPLTSQEITAVQFLLTTKALTATSTAFRVRSQGTSGAAKVTVEAVLERGEHGGLEPTYWRRG